MYLILHTASFKEQLQARMSYLWTEKHQGCIGSTAGQRLPSYGQFSELLQEDENSTGTVCQGTEHRHQRNTKILPLTGAVGLECLTLKPEQG